MFTTLKSSLDMLTAAWPTMQGSFNARYTVRVEFYSTPQDLEYYKTFATSDIDMMGSMINTLEETLSRSGFFCDEPDTELGTGYLTYTHESGLTVTLDIYIS